MRKVFYLIAANEGGFYQEEGSFELHYPLMVNRRKGSSSRWSVSHIQTGRAISVGLSLSAARVLANAIKDCRVWHEALTEEDVHKHLAVETEENIYIMSRRVVADEDSKEW